MACLLRPFGFDRGAGQFNARFRGPVKGAIWLRLSTEKFFSMIFAIWDAVE
jgi:hypothetical protein